MSAFGTDWVWRIVRTAAFSAIGVLVTGLSDSHVWWALPIAAVLSAVVALVSSATSFGSLGRALERGGWTLAQVALAAVPVALWGVDAAYVPLIASGLAVLKGAVAKHVNSPDTASIP